MQKVFWKQTELKNTQTKRNRLNVPFVANDLQTQLTVLDTAEFTMERNHTNVQSVARHLVSLEI